eukprot:466232-Pyramimonas_sp.AAC.1
MQIEYSNGELAESTARGNVLADYFEHAQWQITNLNTKQLSAGLHMGETLQINMDAFTMEELTDVLKHMSVGKAAGVDDIPPEFW